eukprot:UN05497
MVDVCLLLVLYCILVLLHDLQWFELQLTPFVSMLYSALCLMCFCCSHKHLSNYTTLHCTITTLYCYNRYLFIVKTLHNPFCIISNIILGYFVM